MIKFFLKMGKWAITGGRYIFYAFSFLSFCCLIAAEYKTIGADFSLAKIMANLPYKKELIILAAIASYFTIAGELYYLMAEICRETKNVWQSFAKLLKIK